jgi:plasmid stabilization system protein ParE
MYKLHYSTESKNDLLEIKSHIGNELANPQAAERTVAYITKRIRGLTQFPEMGALLSSIIDIESKYRFLVCKKHLAFYRVEENDIFIIRVLYGGRDYASILFGDLLQNNTEA